MPVAHSQIRETIADAGLNLRSHHVREEGEVYIVEDAHNGHAASIALRAEEMVNPFVVLGRIRHVARSLAED